MLYCLPFIFITIPYLLSLFASLTFFVVNCDKKGIVLKRPPSLPPHFIKFLLMPSNKSVVVSLLLCHPFFYHKCQHLIVVLVAKRHSTHLAQKALCTSYYKSPHNEISDAIKTTTITNDSHVNITSSHVSQGATQSCLYLRSSLSWLWKPLKSTSLWWLGPAECRMLTTMSVGIDLMKNYKWFKRSSSSDGNCLKPLRIYQSYYDTVTSSSSQSLYQLNGGFFLV